MLHAQPANSRGHIIPNNPFIPLVRSKLDHWVAVNVYYFLKFDFAFYTIIMLDDFLTFFYSHPHVNLSFTFVSYLIFFPKDL